MHKMMLILISSPEQSGHEGNLLLPYKAALARRCTSVQQELCLLEIFSVLDFLCIRCHHLIWRMTFDILRTISFSG